MTSDTSTALLVIDVQASFTQRPYFNELGRAEYLAAQNALIAGAQARG
jgi:nicotinamidase-related amidase